MTLSNNAKAVFGVALAVSVQGCTVNMYENFDGHNGHYVKISNVETVNSDKSTATKTVPLLPPVNIHFNHNQHNHVPLTPYYRPRYYAPRPVIVIPFGFGHQGRHHGRHHYRH